MYNHPTRSYGGYQFQTNDRLVILDSIKQVRRTWRERLFTLPWRPLKTHNQIELYRPSPHVYFFDKIGVITGHPATIAKLFAALDRVEANKSPIKYGVPADMKKGAP